ncbi:catecholate siderophore receptor fiu [Asticcacaulis biprosthecium C19]|uniref:Catecholate siderophore receptor fiu n=1 Tax=Asticcacaulis biprosthecium C19 TaxID=715226 RepID=F4QN50_9CAUL|nr:catecholate siderophore receptor Fiu [Asticcacaulis biprosthecium]EGF91641.1 catecholate siderophore receptor fiu [Asticcacaulis biprosthecium C19]
MTASIRSRKHSPARYAAHYATLAALALTVPALAPVSVLADDVADSTSEVVVKGERQGFKAAATSSDKRTQAQLDTPQTMVVITSDVIRQQGATTLMDALRNTPGITIQLGENGNTSAGDTFQLRGFSSQTSLFLDGLRDLGAVTRDTFNVGQIEVAKGAAGSEFGRGSSSGYINLVSKLPRLGGGSSATLSAYSSGGYRGTADFDAATGDTSALRVNVFTQDIDAAGRDVANRSGWGIAPAWATGLGTNTRFYVFGQVVKQDNVPDGGIPTIGYDGYDYPTNATIKAGQRVNRENFYGSVNDHEDVEAALITSKIEHDFASGLKLSNTTRYGHSTMDRVLTGVNTGATGITAPNLNDPATWTVNLSRQKVDQENTILANATNLRGSWTTGSITHDLSGGVEVSSESQFNRTYNTSYVTPTGTVSVTVPVANLYNPNPNQALPDPLDTGAYSDGETTTVAAYLFDTVKLGDQWLVNGGVRVDSYKTTTRGARRTTATDTGYTVGTLIPVNLSKDGTAVSWNAGVVYKPRANGSLYAAIGNSVTPPGSANFALSDTATNIGSPNLDPQETANIEVGTKWDLLDNRLSLTAAWYATSHQNEIVEDIDPGAGITVRQFGKRKVEGLEFGAVGQVTPKWQVIAGLATMDTSVEEGQATGNNATGAAARWSPDLTGSLWTSYDVTEKFTVGIGGNYTSEQLRVVAPGAAASSGLSEIPAYWVLNAMAAYDLSERVAVQLNIYNLLDEDYIASLNNGGGRIFPGAPLNGMLTLAVRF